MKIWPWIIGGLTALSGILFGVATGARKKAKKAEALHEHAANNAAAIAAHTSRERDREDQKNEAIENVEAGNLDDTLVDIIGANNKRVRNRKK